MDSIDKIITENINRFIDEETSYGDSQPQVMPDDVFDVLKSECEDYEFVVFYEKDDDMEIYTDNFTFSCSYETKYRWYTDDWNEKYFDVCEMTECTVNVKDVVLGYDGDKDVDVYYILTDTQKQILNSILENNAVEDDNYWKHCDQYTEEDYREDEMKAYLRGEY